MCGGVAIFDYDNDGLMDIFPSNGAKLPGMEKVGTSYDNALLRNKGDGTFEDVTLKAGLLGKQTGYSFGVAAADSDNDGNEDLFIASAGRNTLYHNDRKGNFTDVTPGSGLDQKPANLLSVGAAWFDFDTTASSTSSSQTTQYGTRNPTAPATATGHLCPVPMGLNPS